MEIEKKIPLQKWKAPEPWYQARYRAAKEAEIKVNNQAKPSVGTSS